VCAAACAEYDVMLAVVELVEVLILLSKADNLAGHELMDEGSMDLLQKFKCC
jgi:hypothetical protein